MYDHKGENLFWRHYNPEEIPLINRYALIDGEEPPYPEMWKTDYEMYSAKGLDCDGVPAFSHFTADYIANHHNKDVIEYEPLTVGIVNYWFGWFLWKLNNSHLKQPYSLL